jgi:hypothetical protein
LRPERHLAALLARRGLTAPARLLVDAHLPLAPLLSDVGAAVAPLLRMAGAGGDSLTRLLEDGRGMERMAAALDELEERDAQPS